jgi:hypothetical protein
MSTKPLTAEEIRKKYTSNLKEKEYLQVAGRVLLFRGEHPGGAIITELLQCDENAAMFKASIYLSDGVLVATGHARCTAQAASQAAGRYIEKCETSAIGRALASAGFGTDELADDDNNGFLADSPVAPAQNANGKYDAPKTDPAPAQPPNVAKDNAREWLNRWKQEEGLTEEIILSALGVKRLSEFGDWADPQTAVDADWRLVDYRPVDNKPLPPADDTSFDDEPETKALDAAIDKLPKSEKPAEPPKSNGKTSGKGMFANGQDVAKIEAWRKKHLNSNEYVPMLKPEEIPIALGVKALTMRQWQWNEHDTDPAADAMVKAYVEAKAEKVTA